MQCYRGRILPGVYVFDGAIIQNEGLQFALEISVKAIIQQVSSIRDLQFDAAMVVFETKEG